MMRCAPCIVLILPRLTKMVAIFKMKVFSPHQVLFLVEILAPRMLLDQLNYQKCQSFHLIQHGYFWTGQFIIIVFSWHPKPCICYLGTENRMWHVITYLARTRWLLLLLLLLLILFCNCQICPFANCILLQEIWWKHIFALIFHKIHFLHTFRKYPLRSKT